MLKIEKNILSHIIHFHSQFYHPHELTPNEDFVFVTPMGAFRIGIIPKGIYGDNDRRTGSQILLYTRHAGDLAVERVHEPDDPTGHQLKLKHPERVMTIAIKNRRHDSTAYFAAPDGKIHLDCSSLLKTIPDAMQYIPRILLREATMHGMGDSYLSAHLGYYPINVGDGLSEIDIKTRIETDFGFHTTTPSQTDRAAARIKALKIIQKLSPTLMLRIGRKRQDGSIEEVKYFSPSQFTTAILADAQKRIDDIYKGNDPAGLDKRQIIMFRRAAEAATEKMRAYGRESGRNLKHLNSAIRQLSEWAFGLTDLPTTLLQIVIDNAFADTPISDNIPENWCFAVDKRKHNTGVISEMNQFLVRMKPDALLQFEMLDPAKHRPNFAEFLDLKPASDDVNFKFWLISHFIAPYCTAVDYYGEFSDFADMSSMASVRLINGEVNNGIQYFYDARKKWLYSYFNTENFLPLRRQLPENAEHYFKENMVQFCDMTNFAKPLQTIPFSEFEVEANLCVQSRRRPHLKPSRAPDLSWLNQDPAGSTPIPAPV